ncbi:MAG: hypothetical protein ACJ07L_05740 [Opitutales bacterium]
MYSSPSSKQSALADTLITRSGKLLQNGTTKNLKASLKASSQAIAIIEQIQSPDNPQWVNSLAAALLNHGKGAASLGTESSRALARNDFLRARDILRTIKDVDHPWPRRNLAISLFSLSMLSLDESKIEKAIEFARNALKLQSPYELKTKDDMILSLSARWSLCNALSESMQVSPQNKKNTLSEILKFTDEALSLTLNPLQLSDQRFLEYATGFYRLASRLIALLRPETLSEFLAQCHHKVAFLPRGESSALIAAQTCAEPTAETTRRMPIDDPNNSLAIHQRSLLHSIEQTRILYLEAHSKLKRPRPQSACF